MIHPRSALLISPPVYDTQYWAHWSLPYGLLRVASWLRTKGYVLKLIDCLEVSVWVLVEGFTQIAILPEAIVGRRRNVRRKQQGTKPRYRS